MAIALLALVSMLIMPVSAETLTGELGQEGINSTNWGPTPYMSGGAPYEVLFFKSIEYAGIPTASIRWTKDAVDLFDADAPAWSSASITIRLSNGTVDAGEATLRDGEIIGYGTIGYQRLYNSATPPVEQLGGYTWITFSSLNLTGLSGDTYLFMDYDHSDMYNQTSRGWGSYTAYLPIGGWAFYYEGNNVVAGYQTYNKQVDFFSQYTVTKPSGIGITGTISKTGTNGKLYNTRTFISDLNHATISSEGTANQNNFTFATNFSQIYVSILSVDNIWANTSLLFESAEPTVTPTPSPTIPPGYIITYVRTFDPLTNSDIHGTNISMYDVEAATWTNYTADPDGRGEIYTLPYHTLNLYGTYPTEGVYNDAELLGAETGYTGGKLFYLDMYPYTPAPASGYVELYTTVRNRDDKSPVTYASIGTTIISTGAYFGSSSGSTGTDIYTYPNDTALRIVVNKPGYQTATIYTNTGDDEKKYVIINMDRSTVTPTVTATIIPGETTVRPTYAPYCDPYASNYDEGKCNAGKDAGMMGQVRDAGPILISLAIMATLFGLIKLMGKK